MKYVCTAAKAESIREIDRKALDKKLKSLENNYKQNKKEDLLWKIEVLKQAEKLLETDTPIISEKESALLKKEIRLKYRNSSDEDKEKVLASLCDKKTGYGYLFSEAEIKQIVSGKNKKTGNNDFSALHDVLKKTSEDAGLKKEMGKIINRILKEGTDIEDSFSKAPAFIANMKKECDVARRGGNPLPEEQAVSLWIDKILPCTANISVAEFTYILNLLRTPEIAEVIGPGNAIDEEDYEDTLDLIKEKTACKNSEKLLHMYAKLFQVALPESGKKQSKSVGITETLAVQKNIADLNNRLNEEHKRIAVYKNMQDGAETKIRDFIRTEENTYQDITDMFQLLSEYISENEEEMTTGVLSSFESTKNSYVLLHSEIEALKQIHEQIRKTEETNVNLQYSLIQEMLQCEKEHIEDLKQYAESYNNCVQYINKKSWIKLSGLLKKMKVIHKKLSGYADTIPSLMGKYEKISTAGENKEYEERIESIKNNYDLYCRIEKDRTEWESKLKKQNESKYVKIADALYIICMVLYGVLLLKISIPVNPEKRILIGIVIPGMISLVYMSCLCIKEKKKMFVADQWKFVAAASIVMMFLSNTVNLFMTEKSVNLPILYAAVGGLVVTAVVVLLGNVINIAVLTWRNHKERTQG